MNQSGMCIEIKGNQFKFFIPESEHPTYINDTLAACTMNKISADLIEINSVPAYVAGLKGFRVVQYVDSNKTDSVKVTFSIPYTRSNLDVSVFSERFRLTLSYCKNRKFLFIPKNCKEISILVSPGNNIIPHSFDGSYYGVLFFSYYEYSIKDHCDSISVEIPAIDDSFFEKYYIKGEYARIVNETIIWKGDKFVRKEKRK